MKVELFLEFMNKISPEENSSEWDNSGIQILFRERDLKKILVTLDVTKEVIDEAISKKSDMILAHHPLIFKPVSKIDNKEQNSSNLIKLIENRISVYSAHTSFDIAQGGNNDYLIELLEFNAAESTFKDIESSDIEFVRFAYLKKEMSIMDISELIKRKLQICHKLNTVYNNEEPIEKVAICTGAGGNLVKYALDNECDLLITGDINYHTALEAKECNLKLIDITHYHSEKIFIKNISQKIRLEFENKLFVDETDVDQNPFNMI